MTSAATPIRFRTMVSALSSEEETEHRSWFEMTIPFTGDVSYPRPLACGMESPSGVMLCELPESRTRHWFGQHMGIDRNGCFRGWKDDRGTSQ